jgi:hypothetical protein
LRFFFGADKRHPIPRSAGLVMHECNNYDQIMFDNCLQKFLPCQCHETSFY